MPRRSNLEAELLVATQQFVQRIVALLRTASFAEVAALSSSSAAEKPAAAGRAKTTPKSKRADLEERVLQVLMKAHAPMGVRALSGELNVAPDLLAAPLKKLRADGRVAKHGEKR